MACSRTLFRILRHGFPVRPLVTKRGPSASLVQARYCSSISRSIDETRTLNTDKDGDEGAKRPRNLMQGRPEDAELIERKQAILGRFSEEFRGLQTDNDSEVGGWPYRFIAYKTMTLDRNELNTFWEDVATAFAPIGDDVHYTYHTTRVKGVWSKGWPVVVFHLLANGIECELTLKPPTNAAGPSARSSLPNLPISERVARARMLRSILLAHPYYSGVAAHRIAVLAYARTLILEPENESEAIQLVDDVMASYPLPVLDLPTGKTLIGFFALTSQWRRCLAIREELKLVDPSNPKVLPVAHAAMRHGDLALALQLLSFKYENARERPASFGNHVLPFVAEVAKKYDPTFLNRYLRFRYETHPAMWLSHDLASQITDYFSTDGADVGEAAYAEIRDGRCSHCGHVMRNGGLTEAEFVRMRQAVQDAVFRSGHDLYITSTPAELQQFQDFLDRKRAQYDVVLDGLNVLHSKSGTKWNFDFLNRFVDKLASRYNLRSLIVVRGRINKGWLHKMEGMADVYSVSETSLDDAFIVHAALAGGPDTFMVSNDYLRDIRAKMAAEDRLLFMRWQMHRQIAWTRAENNRILMPFGCDVMTQEDAGGWHVAHDMPDNYIHYRPFPGATLCLRTKEPYSDKEAGST